MNERRFHVFLAQARRRTHAHHPVPPTSQTGTHLEIRRVDSHVPRRVQRQHARRRNWRGRRNRAWSGASSRRRPAEGAVAVDQGQRPRLLQLQLLRRWRWRRLVLLLEHRFLQLLLLLRLLLLLLRRRLLVLLLLLHHQLRLQPRRWRHLEAAGACIARQSVSGRNRAASMAAHGGRPPLLEVQLM
jgi:hypothetical protein